jgi:hypothetical protein
LEDSSGARGECAHKFKRKADGVLVCELCGLARQPRMSAEPLGEDRDLDLSRGASYARKQARMDGALRSIGDKLRWLFWW